MPKRLAWKNFVVFHGRRRGGLSDGEHYVHKKKDDDGIGGMQKIQPGNKGKS